MTCNIPGCTITHVDHIDIVHALRRAKCHTCGRVRHFPSPSRLRRWHATHARGCTPPGVQDRTPSTPRAPSRPWTPEEDEIVANVTTLEDALDLLPGRAAASIHTRRRRLSKRGVVLSTMRRTTGRNLPWTDDENRAAAALDTWAGVDTVLPGRSRAAILKQRIKLAARGYTIAPITH